MEAKLEKDLEEMLEIATAILEEGRKPSEKERSRFLELKHHIEEQSVDWRARLVDQIDRLAAALEGIGM